MGYFDEANKVKNKKLTQEDIEKGIKEKKCPFCGSEKSFNAMFNATIEALRDFFLNEEGKIEWCDDIEHQQEAGGLTRNPTIICKLCFREIPKEVWEKWFEFRGKESGEEIRKLAEKTLEKITLELGNFADTAKVLDEMKRIFESQ